MLVLFINVYVNIDIIIDKHCFMYLYVIFEILILSVSLVHIVIFNVYVDYANWFFHYYESIRIVVLRLYLFVIY